ncbi:MAG: hypothetical protein ABID40_02825 [Candidatus Bipolaricaulota bacterium]
MEYLTPSIRCRILELRNPFTIREAAQILEVGPRSVSGVLQLMVGAGEVRRIPVPRTGSVGVGPLTGSRTLYEVVQNGQEAPRTPWQARVRLAVGSLAQEPAWTVPDLAQRLNVSLGSAHRIRVVLQALEREGLVAKILLYDRLPPRIIESKSPLASPYGQQPLYWTSNPDEVQRQTTARREMVAWLERSQ